LFAVQLVPRFADDPWYSFSGIQADGVDDLITGPGAGTGPVVKVFRQGAFAFPDDFLAYDAGFTGGVTVAAGDVDGDGFVDIITGAGAGGGPHVRAFTGAGHQVIRDFFAFDPTQTGGVRVATADVTGDGVADL